jgi:hypothetical protein
MKPGRRTLTPAQERVLTAFWRLAASVTGYAVDHPQLMRVLPISLLAAAAFALGRAAGSLLTAR